MGARLNGIQEVTGSIPVRSTIFPTVSVLSRAGVVDHAFNDDLRPGTQGLPLDLLRQVEPLTTGEVVASDTAFLSDHVVERYPVVLFEAAK